VESSSSASTDRILSEAALWHKQRRKEMRQKYGDQIRSLETQSSSQALAFPLLVVGNLTLLGLSILSGHLSVWQVILLSIFPGSIFSLWQLQILHDNLHGSFWNKSKSKLWGIPKSSLQEWTLVLGSLPCVFGYYLYLKFGHLSHHSHVGDFSKASLKQLFDSTDMDFEDGDVLFVAHRMKLKGPIGPTFNLPGGNNFVMSLSKTGFDFWKAGRGLRNSLAFWCSFLLERLLLTINDVVVSLTGRNYFFPNKPVAFHRACARYARIGTLMRITLLRLAGFKSFLFLWLSETLWSLPPHPCTAMFVTNHGSESVQDNATYTCWPTASTYAGRWYSLLTLGTNYHLEHHDFPSIPLHKLGLLHQIAPEYYPQYNKNIWKRMRQAFEHPDWYACMKVGVGAATS
jgi:fatty acid desaturase